MFEQSFKNIDDLLRKDAGISTEMDYTEQTSWILFLKYLDILEIENKNKAELNNTKYNNILSKEYSWNTWACPKDKNDIIDDDAILGDNLLSFVNDKLFPYLANFKSTGKSYNSIEYKIGEIFSMIKNEIRSGYILRKIINEIDKLKFGGSEEKHELSYLYEDKIKNMGNSGRNGGEYYTPRPLIRTIIKALNLNLGETIYDGAAGSAGFLVEAYEYLLEKNRASMSSNALKKLKENTFFAQEKKPLPYIIGVMNMILHGIESPNFVHTNTLEENIKEIEEKDRYNVILANPPFGGAESQEILHNFPIKSSETALLFLQHYIKKLKANGKAGVVIKNTFLSNGDNASVEVRRELLNTCNLFAILDLPAKVFSAGVKTIVLFFEKGKPTKNIWYYQLNLNRSLGKTNPLNDNDLKEFLELYENKSDSENSWTVDVETIEHETLDLSVKNPNKNDEIVCREPTEINKELMSINKEIDSILNEVSSIL